MKKQRLNPINESDYTKICEVFKDTYVEENYNKIKINGILVD